MSGIASEESVAGPYTANGSQTAFTFAFYAQATADITVLKDGAVVTNYSIAFNGSNLGGTVNFDAAPANGAIILIGLDFEALQSTVFANAGFSSAQASALQAAIDRGRQDVLQVKRAAPRLPLSALSQTFDGEISIPGDGSLDGLAGSAPIINGTEDGWTLGTMASSTISAAMVPVVTAATTDAALGLLNGVLEVATKAALKTLAAGVADAVYVRARTTAGDGGGGLFRWDSSNLSSQVTADPQEGIYIAPTSASTGASGAWVRDTSLTEGYDVRWWGVILNSSAAAAGNTTAIDACTDLADTNNTKVWLPEGTIWVGKLTGSGTPGYAVEWKSGVVFDGPGKFSTTIKLADSQDCNVIESTGATALFGGGTEGGVEGGGIHNIAIDGNMANQTAGSGIVIYGDQFDLMNIRIVNVEEYGVRSEWAQFGNEGMDGRIENIEVDTCGKHGFWWKGPHDSILQNVEVIDAGQTTDNTYDGILIQDYGASQLKSCHAWHRSTVTNRMRYAVNNEALGATLVDMHCEGAKTGQLRIAGQYTQCLGGRAYASFNGAPNVIVTQPCTVRGIFMGGPSAGQADCFGVQFGTGGGGENVTAIDFDGYLGSSANDIADFTNDGGKNSIRIRGFVAATAAITGTPNAANAVDIDVWDGGGARFIYRRTRDEIADAATNTTVFPVQAKHSTTGTATTSFGVGYEALLESGAGTERTVGRLFWAFSDATDGSEDTTLFFQNIVSGSLATVFDITSTGLASITGGLNVGFTGTPVADRIAFGDATAYLDFGSGTTPSLNFDTGDAILYNRTSNRYEFYIGSTNELVLAATVLFPATAGGLALGAVGGFGFNGAVFNAGTPLTWDDAIDYTVTHSAGLLTFSGGISVAGGQIAFPATANPSADANTLDDYEEGEWTPAASFATPGDSSIVLSQAVGSYVKIGKMVTLWAQVTTSTFTHTTASGNFQITGLPFTAENITNLTWRGLVRWQGITKANYTQVNASIAGGGTTMTFAASGSGQAAAGITTADMPTGGTVNFSIEISYRAA